MNLGCSPPFKRARPCFCRRWNPAPLLHTVLAAVFYPLLRQHPTSDRFPKAGNSLLFLVPSRRGRAAWRAAAFFVLPGSAAHRSPDARSNEPKRKRPAKASFLDSYILEALPCDGLSLWQYWVHSLSVQLEQRSVSLLMNQKRSGCRMTLSSHATQTIAASASRLYA